MSNGAGVRDYIVSLLNKDLRIDGRGLTDFRKPVSIEYNISDNAEGSARVKMGETEVIAGIKLNVGIPYPDSDDEGVLIVGAELLPLSSPDFESGPPDEWATELARVVDRGIRESGMIDVKKLCIRQGELVWTIFLDIYTINDAGNLIDASALAAVAALKQAHMLKLDGDKVLFGEHTKTKIPIIRTPITVTLYKIGSKIIIDPNTKEEKSADARLSVAISEKGEIHALQKGGNKGISFEDVEHMIDLAEQKTREIRKVLGE